MKLQYEEITLKLLESCFDVSNELGAGFLGSVYENALVIALSQSGLRVEAQHPLTVKFRGAMVCQLKYRGRL